MENRIATTVEQSMKLLEFGLDPESADMWWNGFVDDNKEIQWSSYPEFLSSDVSIPAWSLSALLGLMPVDFHLDKYGSSYSVIEESVVMRILFDTPLEAVYSAVCGLLQNGQIKTEKI